MVGLFWLISPTRLIRRKRRHLDRQRALDRRHERVCDQRCFFKLDDKLSVFSGSHGDARLLAVFQKVLVNLSHCARLFDVGGKDLAAVCGWEGVRESFPKRRRRRRRRRRRQELFSSSNYYRIFRLSTPTLPSHSQSFQSPCTAPRRPPASSTHHLCSC